MNKHLKTFCRMLGAGKVRDCSYYLFEKMLNSIQIVPQTYSFMTFGAHGVGLHAFLYYLSLCKDIYPLPIHILCPHKIWFGKYGAYISSKFLINFLKNYDFFRKMKWGLTIDGVLKDMDWINRNCTLRVPAFSIVRDPIAILTSHVNWNLSNNILDFNRVVVDIEAIRYLLLNLEISINFKTNLDKLKDRCESITYIDTHELVGDMALATMQNVILKIDGCCQNGGMGGGDIKAREFGMSVNGPIQRRMPKIFHINGIDFRVSPFSNQFSLFEPKYKREYVKIFDIYRSDFFPSIDFYITASSLNIPKGVRDRFYSDLDNYFCDLYEKMQVYEQNKMHYEDVIKLLRQSRLCDAIKRKIEFETSDLLTMRPDLSHQWKAMNTFLGV